MTDLQAVLFDLDDTLLGNNMDRFLQSYFPLLANYARELLPPEQFLGELMAGTQAAIADQDPTTTNREVFWSVFSYRTGLDSVTTEPFVNRFYQEQFGQLESVTERRPAAARLVQMALDRGWQVVIATNPLFPLSAIEQRLAWAGIPADQYPYALVTGYENMHATKPSHAYYQEILDGIGVAPDQAMMAGDDWVNDIVPAFEMGLSTFWIAEADAALPDPAVLIDGQGNLNDLYAWLAGNGR